MVRANTTLFIHGGVMGENIKKINTEEIVLVLNRAEVFIIRTIYATKHLMDYHPGDVSSLVCHARNLNITIPPHIEENIEDFLLRELSHNLRHMPFQNTVSGISYLLLKGCELERLRNAVEYIFSFQNENGGIGSYEGDVSRIPNTGMFLSTILSKKYENEGIFGIYENQILKACNFLINEWTKDASQGNALPQKGALVLDTLLKCLDLNLEIHDLNHMIRNAVEIITEMQNENGAWTFLSKRTKNRVKLELSAPNITAMVMCSLCDVYLKEKSIDTPILSKGLSGNLFNAIKKGSTYLCETQTKFGFWHAHSNGELFFIAGKGALALKKTLEVLKYEQQ